MYTRGQVIEFIEKAFGPVKLSNGGQNASVVCPNCNKLKGEKQKKKLVIHTSSFLAHCWVCNIKTKNIYYIIKKFVPSLAQQFKDNFLSSSEIIYDDFINDSTVEELSLPNGFTFLADKMNERSFHFRKAISYLKDERHVTERDFWYYKYGITLEDEKYKNRIIIPSFDEDGDLNFFTTRKYYGKTGLKSMHCEHAERTHIAFNEINIDWSEELTIVEGPFDLAKCNDNATCMLGSDLNEEHYLFQKIVEHNTPILLAYDDDAVKKMYNTAKLLSQYGIKVRIFRLPDGVHDVGEMKKEQFISLLPHAKIFNSDDYLRYRIELL